MLHDSIFYKDYRFFEDSKLEFRDAAIYIHSAADTFLDLVADGAIRLTAPDVIVSGDFGIGMTPLRKLSVRTGADENFYVRSGTDHGGSGVAIDSLNDADTVRGMLILAANPLYITGGYTGFGTLTPGSLVEIAGTTHVITGALQLHGSTYNSVFFMNDNVGAAARNWSISTPYTALGTFEFRVGNAQGDDPVTTGATMVRFNSDGTVTVAGCLTDGTCEIMKDRDALSIIEDILSLGDGTLDEHGHEHMDMGKIWQKYPFLVHKQEDGFFDRLGSKSDLLYVAVLQLAGKLEQLEARFEAKKLEV